MFGGYFDLFGRNINLLWGWVWNWGLYEEMQTATREMEWNLETCWHGPHQTKEQNDGGGVIERCLVIGDRVSRAGLPWA